MPEQRHFHRIKFAVETDIHINGTTCATSLVDISLKGALVSLPVACTAELGDQCRLTIHLNDPDAVLQLTGTVVHLNDGLVGVKITLIDIESMIHLRRLVTLNSEDPDQVMSELTALFDSSEGHEPTRG